MASRDKELILVTGSSGLLGTEVCRRLHDDYRIVGLDQFEPTDPDTVDEYIFFDVTSNESVEHALKDVRLRHGEKIASVVHLAAYHEFSARENPLYEQVTVGGTARLLDALQDLAVEQFVFSSTMLVHKPTQLGEPIDEDWPTEADWPYPQSKIDAEEVIRKERSDIPAVLLRIAGIYDDYCHSIPISHHIERIYERDLTSRFHPGDLSHGQSFLHMEDFLDALQKTIEKREVLPEEIAILLGEAKPMSYEELQKTLGRLIHGEEGEDWVTTHIPKPIAKAGAWIEDKTPYGEDDPFIKPFMVDIADHHYELDLSRARKLLGWEPRHSLKGTLPKMIDALKRDPIAWYEEHDLSLPEDLAERAGKTASAK